MNLAIKNGRNSIVGLIARIDNTLFRHEMDHHDASGYLPIHYAVLGNNVSVLRFLVGKGADINSTDVENRTPLELAFRFGYMGIARELSDLGCDDSGLDTYKGKAMIRAIESGSLYLVKRLLPHMGSGEITYDYSKIEDLAHSLGKDDILQIIIEEKELFRSLSSEKDSKGETAIRLVDRSSVVELLTKNGTSNNSENSQGKTPLRLPALSDSNSDCLTPSRTPKSSLRGKNAQSSTSQRRLNRIGSQSSSFSSDNYGAEALTSQMRVRRSLSMSSPFNESGNYGIGPSSSIENPTVERQENISRGRVGRN